MCHTSTLFEIALFIDTVVGGCITGNDDQLLGMQTSSDTSWAGADGNIYGNIFADGGWKGWRKLDTSNCDDHERGQWDYFDDFKGVESKWEAMALYQCSNDGILVEAVEYWDG